MGTWTLENITGQTSDYTTSELYGNNVKVAFRLQYKPEGQDTFAEPPKLDWKEKFTMKEYAKNEWWEFESNMYTHNPCSQTLKVWCGRYIHAYKTAMGTPDGLLKGSSTLLDNDKKPVQKKALPADLTSGTAQADAVRAYLKKKGGALLIIIHDIPSINIPKAGVHKERLLTFDLGLVGDKTRWRGVQYLNLDGTKGPSSFKRFCGGERTGYAGFTTFGMTKTAPPTLVSMVRPPTFMPGECW
jgi:hypothetical protein